MYKICRILIRLLWECESSSSHTTHTSHQKHSEYKQEILGITYDTCL